jgi:2-dehydropantoate 2-reductase
MGEFRRWPEPRTHDIAGLFRHSGVPCNVTDNLARAHWEKLIWNIPFNGLGVAGSAGFEAVSRGEWDPRQPIQPCLTTDKLLADLAWSALVRELMLEVIHAANRLRYSVSANLADQQIERTRSMGPYKASTLIDFERGQPLELESLFLEPLRQAQSAQAAVPHLQNLCRVLQQLDQARASVSH